MFGMVSLQSGIIWFWIASSSWEQDLPAALCSFDALPVNESFDASKNVVYNISDKQDCYRLCYKDEECSYLEYKDGECIIYHETTSDNEESLKANFLDSVYKLTRDNREPRPCQIVKSNLTRSLPETIEIGPGKKLATAWQVSLGGLCYKSFASQKNATEAENMCNQNGGHLASIHSDKVNDIIKGRSKSLEVQEILIGLKIKDTPKRQQYWLDGSKMDYENWREGEPTNKNGQENCAAVTSVGKWNDVRCSRELYFVCVVPSDVCSKN